MHWREALNTEPSASATRRGAWHGSRCVPTTTAVRAFVRALEAELRRLSHCKTLLEHMAYHNLFTLYVYVITEFATALRPRVIPPLTAQTVDTHSGLVLIADKDSQFTEERLAILPPTALIVLRDLQHVANPALLKRLCASSRVDKDGLGKLNDPMFYFIDPETKDIHAFGCSRFARVLAGYPDLRAQWPFPPNVHRHFVRAWLFNRARLPFEVINYVMGHKHFCHEPFHVHSSTQIRDLHAVLADELERVLSIIGVTPVRFHR